MQVEISVQTVFSAPTVAEMAEVVEELSLGRDQEAERMERMLRLVEELPEHELQSLLDSDGSATD